VRTVATLAGGLAILAVAGSLLVPLKDVSLNVQPDQANQVAASSKNAPTGPPRPTESQIDAICDRPLRPSLLGSTVLAISAPATPAPESAMQSPLSGLSLVGTIGSSLAMIQGPDGTVEVTAVGDQVNDADVVSIQPDRVTLRLAGRFITLSKQPEPQ